MSRVWTAAGRLADVLQIVTVIGGGAVVVLSVLGVNPLSDPGDQLLMWVAVGFAVTGLGSIVSAVVRTQRHEAGFEADGASTNRILYLTGAAMLVLALVSVGVLVLRPPAPLCVAPASAAVQEGQHGPHAPVLLAAGL